MSITFTASSLEDIAKHFDRMRNNAANRLLNADTKVAKSSARAEEVTWQNAAMILRQTTLAPAPDVLAVPPGAIGATPKPNSR